MEGGWGDGGGEWRNEGMGDEEGFVGMDQLPNLDQGRWASNLDLKHEVHQPRHRITAAKVHARLLRHVHLQRRQRWLPRQRCQRYRLANLVVKQKILGGVRKRSFHSPLCPNLPQCLQGRSCSNKGMPRAGPRKTVDFPFDSKAAMTPLVHLQHRHGTCNSVLVGREND